MLLRAAVASVLLVAATASATQAANPVEKRAGVLTAELRQRAGKPEAIASLAALLRVEEQLPPGTLVPALREVAEGKNHHPLVAAQAAFRLAIEDERRGDDEQAQA